MLSRRAFGSLMGAATCVGGAAASSASAPTLDLDAISLAAHEAAMRLAIAAAKANPFYPFGAVIIGAADRAVLAQGVNNSKANPILHGEVVAINDYAARHGNQGWADGILYTTGEPCPMCMSGIFEADLPPEQYAYRPGRNAQQAAVEVEELLFSRTSGSR
jgi:tRNA(adenine34) deaminase